MLIDRPARKQKPISLTPLVDVIFLLLLFFMLSSTFTTFGQLQISAPGGSGGTAELPKALLVLEEDRQQLNGRTVLEENLLSEVRSLRDKDIDSLLILVRGNASTQKLVSVMTDLKTLDWLTTTIAEGR